MSYIRICDRCASRSEPSINPSLDYNSKWGNITVMIPSKGNHTLLFCPNCIEQIYARFDLVKEVSDPRQHIIDLLIDLMYDTACDAISNHNG